MRNDPVRCSRRSRRPRGRIESIVVGWLVLLAAFGTTIATAQFTQGTDQQGSTAGTPSPDPADWSFTIYDTATYGTTITFELNPCEWVLYMDDAGRPLSCLPRDVACATLADMETKVENALLEWDNLDPDALTFVVDQPATCEPGCTVNDTDLWQDDGIWTVTRTYHVAGTLDPEECPNAATGALSGGAGLRFYDDPPDSEDPTNTVRWVRECDVVFFEDKWDNAVEDCTDAGFTPAQCGGAWQMALAHELGHCLGFGHSYLTRKILGPLKDDLASEIELDFGLPSIMAYDRAGNVEVAGHGSLNPYDKATFLEAYSDGPDPASYFTALGEVRDSCPSGELQFGVGLFALEKFTEQGVTKWRAVQMNISGQDPLNPGRFRLEHLNRSQDYRLLVVDLKNANQALTGGWDFDQTQLAPPGLKVVRTDQWSETNSSDLHTYEMSGQFATGFGHELLADFTEPQLGNYDAGCIELTFP